MPGLSWDQFHGGILADPLNLAHRDDAPLPRPTRLAKDFERAIRHVEGQPNCDILPARLPPGLTRRENLVGLTPQAAHALVAEDMKVDRVPHPALLVLLLVENKDVPLYLDRVFESYEYIVTPHKEKHPGSPVHPRMSWPLLGKMTETLPAIYVLPGVDDPMLGPEDLTIVLDLECGKRRVGPGNENVNVPIAMTAFDLHGHAVLHVGSKPPGGVTDLCTRYSGVSAENYREFPTFDQAYPYLYQLLDSRVKIVGCGLDNDFRALGIYMPASRIYDIGSFKGLKLLATRTA